MNDHGSSEAASMLSALALLLQAALPAQRHVRRILAGIRFELGRFAGRLVYELRCKLVHARLRLLDRSGTL
jgi:hypothetical protein